MAESAADAIKLDKQTPVHDVWLQEDFEKRDIEKAFEAAYGKEKKIGFSKK